MLTCHELSLITNNKYLFKDLSFTLLPGSITILRGKNGIGKSSLLRIITGLQKPRTGYVSINGENINDTEKSLVGYLGHNLALKSDLSVEDNLLFWSKLYGSELMLAASIHYWGLNDILQEPVYKLSSGVKKKVALARLMSTNTGVWLVDEADVNLDEHNFRLLYNCLVIKANNGGIILWVSHLESLKGVIPEIHLEDFCA